MYARIDCSLFTLTLLLAVALPARAIEVTPVAGPGDALALTNSLVGTLSLITVNSASFLIDTGGGLTAASEIRAIGTFTSGNAGGQLPTINQLDPQNPISYAGGIGIREGVCLCTGLVTDADADGANAVPGSGVGIQGPNNGFALTEFFDQSTILNAGEVSFRTGKPRDVDFFTKVTTAGDNEGDATVLQFQINISAPGFLRISFVFASDEHPFHIAEGQFNVNDSMAVFVRQESCPNPAFENITLLKVPGQPSQSMSLRELRDCGPIMFRDNQIAPAPSADLIPGKLGNFPTSPHGFDKTIPPDGFNRPDDGVPYYNHDFGGFTKRLTRETPRPLAPGAYTIKIVVQDVFDRNVDSAIFIQTASLLLFNLNPGDYNGDGIVTSADYDVWRAHFGQSPAGFYDGDGNGNCVVDSADYVVWRNRLGQTGNKDLCADFDRSGVVNANDRTIQLAFLNVLTRCASRFEGDADGDGDVDACDDTIWQTESSSGVPLRPCACGGSGGSSMPSGGSDGDLAWLAQQLPESPDVDGDGDVDEQDLAALDLIVHRTPGVDNSASSTDTTSAPQPEPTLAESQPESGPLSPEPNQPSSESGAPAEEPAGDSEPAPHEIPPEFPVPPGPPPEAPR